jgi:hypothetical protein
MQTMIGLHGAKDAANHGDLKPYRCFECCRVAGQFVPEAKVFGAPGDPLAEANQSGGNTAPGNGLLLAMDIRKQVDFDIAR